MSKTNLKPLILDGREVANEVLKVVKTDISYLKSKNKRLPGLAVILVGDNKASHTYVTNKEKKCIELEIHSEVYKFPANIPEIEVIKKIKELNNSVTLDGILLQLPLPKHMKSENLLESILPIKDVDGLHPLNMGKLIAGQECLKPCTPQGVIEILKYYAIPLEGRQVVMVGRSVLVGKPLSILLLGENATVTIVHSKSKNINEITKSADIVISAIGKPNLIKSNWIKHDSVIIDIGINKITEDGKEKIVGDVDFKDVSSICKAITPVPGGVGPMTIAMLILNTLKAYKMRNEW